MSKVVRVERIFKVSADNLFELWTDPEHLKRWHHPHPTESSTPEVRVDLRIGGHFLIAIEAQGKRHVVTGQYTHIERPSRLAYTWQWEGAEEVTHVSLRFQPVPGGTLLELTHEHADDSTMAAGHEQGWLGCLTTLAAVLDTVREETI